MREMISYTAKNKKHKNNNLRQDFTKYWMQAEWTLLRRILRNSCTGFISLFQEKKSGGENGKGRGVMPIISQVVLKQLTEPLRFHPKDPAPA